MSNNNLETRVRSLENFRQRAKNSLSTLENITDSKGREIVSNLSEYLFRPDPEMTEMPKIPQPKDPDPPQESILTEVLLDVFQLVNQFIIEQSSRINFGFPKDTRDIRNTLFKRARSRTVPSNPTIEEVNDQLSDSVLYLTSYMHSSTRRGNINELKRQHKILGELITVANTLSKEVQKLI